VESEKSNRGNKNEWLRPRWPEPTQEKKQDFSRSVPVAVVVAIVVPVVVPIVVPVAIAIMMAAFARFFQLVAFLLCLAAVRTVFAFCFLQALLGPAYLILTVARLRADCARGKTENNECGNEKLTLYQIMEQRASLRHSDCTLDRQLMPKTK